MITFLKNSKINFVSKFKFGGYLSIIFIILGVFFYLFKGPELGIDFKGGVELIVQLDSSYKDKESISEYLISNNIKYSNIKSYGNNKVRILFDIGTEHKLTNQEFNIISYNKIGSTISDELKYDALKALFIAVLLIGIYIIIRFDWYSSIGAISALIHDIFIVITFLVLFGYEFNANIIAAFLIIIGYSLNDTIVVFDRIRENIFEYSNMILSQIVNLSLNETLSRTVVTSLTTLFVVISIFIFGGGSLRGLSFALMIGVLSGTYSSIFVASPIMMFLREKYYQEEENERDL